jgi:hypothetical protein
LQVSAQTGTFDCLIGAKGENLMRPRSLILVVVSAVLVCAALAQESKPAGVLSSSDLQSVAPSSFFYRGQSASTQLRNTGGIRTAAGKYVLAGLVDTAGYASDVAQKYQGFFITEVKVKIGGSGLNPGEYGFGFAGDKFVVTDVSAADVVSASVNNDANLKRPVPLKIAQDGNAYRLYAGRKYVTLEVE